MGNDHLISSGPFLCETENGRPSGRLLLTPESGASPVALTAPSVSCLLVPFLLSRSCPLTCPYPASPAAPGGLPPCLPSVSPVLPTCWVLADIFVSCSSTFHLSSHLVPSPILRFSPWVHRPSPPAIHCSRKPSAVLLPEGPPSTWQGLPPFSPIFLSLLR